MPNFQSFFKSKVFVVLIPVLALFLLTLGYFFVSNNSQKAQKTSSQNSSSTSSSANSISQNPSQGNSASSNSQSSIFPNSTQNVNSTSSQLSNSKNEISKPEQLFSQNNQIQLLIADSEHDVVVLEECDLAVRFPKNVDNNKVRFFNGPSSSDPNFISETRFLSRNQNKGFYISCFKNDQNISKISDEQNTKPQSSQLDYKALSVEEFKKENNWFANPVDIKNINSFIYKNQTQYSVEKGVSFVYNNKGYGINYMGGFESLVQLQFNSLAPSVPSVKLENSVQATSSVLISQKTLQNCDALECFTGTIGTQPVILKKVKDEGAGMGSSYYSGILTYTKAGNTPIPIKWRQVNSVDCGLEEIYLCRDITIDEDIPSGGTLRQLIKYNKNTKQEEKSQWTWTSKDGKTFLPVTLNQVDRL